MKFEVVQFENEDMKNKFTSQGQDLNAVIEEINPHLRFFRTYEDVREYKIMTLPNSDIEVHQKKDGTFFYFDDNGTITEVDPNTKFNTIRYTFREVLRDN